MEDEGHYSDHLRTVIKLVKCLQGRSSIAPLAPCRGVAVMEDEGHYSDHTSGVSSTDGTWHHIAVTWRSADGETKLYDNGREVGLRPGCRLVFGCRCRSSYPM